MTYLATTGLRELWDTSQDIVYLGAWCWIPDDMNGWNAHHDSILPSPWADAQRYETAARYLEELHERLLDFFTDIANTHLAEPHSPRFWRLVLSKWLHEYTARLYDQYAGLQEAFAQYPNATTTIVQLEDAKHLKTRAWRTDSYKTHWNKLQDYSAILRGMGKQFPVRTISNEELDSWTIPAPEKAEKIVEHTAPIELKDYVFGWLHCHPNTLETLETGFGGTDTVTHLESPNLDDILPKNNDKKYGKKVRAALLEFPTTTEFERIFIPILAEAIPPRYVEQFAAMNAFVLEHFKGTPQYIISGLGWYESEVFKLVAANANERGSQLVGVQHGAIYGVYRELPNKLFEEAISDKYLAWGWQSDSPKVQTTPSLQTSYYLKNQHLATNSKATEILYMVNQVIPYLQDFRSAVKCYGSDSYVDWQLQFLGQLPAELLENLTFRFKKNQNLEVWQYVQSQFPNIQLESRDVPFLERARDARVIVVDCCTQVYTEALLLKPTILYWNTDVWRMSDQVQPYLNDLAEAEILFFSPQAAAAKLQAIYDNPQQWWNRPKTIAARTRFLQRFAYPAVNWLEQWKKILGVEKLALAE